MEENSQIIQRIKKLLKHSDSAKETGSLAESEAFAVKAQQLLLEYNLEMESVVNAADIDEFKIGFTQKRFLLQINKYQAIGEEISYFA